MDINKLVTDFIEYCEVDRGLSSGTAAKYDYRLSKFVDWAKGYLHKEKILLEDMTTELIRKFRLYLNREELMDSTRYNYMVTIRAFLKYLSKHDYRSIPPEKIELSKYNPARSLKFLTPEQLDKLFAAPMNRETRNNNRESGKIIGIRDRAILELLFSTGLRVSELASLDREMIDFKTREFTVIGKGQHRRIVFLSDGAIDWLKKYLDKRDDDYKPLFLHYSGPKTDTDGLEGSVPDKNGTRPQEGSIRDEEKKDMPEDLQKNEKSKSGVKNAKNELDQSLDDPDGERFRLSVRSIQRIVKKYVKQIGLNVDATPHTLRHSFATDLLNAGADLRTVQESLGHKNVSTTQIYTHITNLQLKKAHKEFHGKWRDKE